jgi:hypothetical protein
LNKRGVGFEYNLVGVLTLNSNEHLNMLGQLIVKDLSSCQRQKPFKNVDLISNTMHCEENNMLMTGLRLRLNTNEALLNYWCLPQVAHQVMTDLRRRLNTKKMTESPF